MQMLLKDEIKDVQSPLNYTGGKFKLLPQIKPLFPEKINVFVDLFCGGCNVGLNVKSNKTIFNDYNTEVIGLFKALKRIHVDEVIDKIESIISHYGLSNTYKNGYDYYACDNSEGLAKYNMEPFMHLRYDFNNKKVKDEDYYLKLYVIIVFAFNNQIRFNRSGKYNLPVGKRDFNKNMREKLVNFLLRVNSKNHEFISDDFYNFDLSGLDKDSFIYIDPPYLISCASYNENDGWSSEKENKLLSFIDKLHSKNIKFALSNVLRDKGKSNDVLLNWLANRDYKTNRLLFKYSNSNYQIKDRNSITEEVLITNYS